MCDFWPSARRAEPKAAAPPDQRKAEHRERNGERQRATQDEEPRRGKRRNAAHLANGDGEIAGIGKSELPPGKQQQDE